MSDGEEDSELSGNYYSLVILSQFIGYSYVFLWGGSFVQQIILNSQLKNVEGINLDFVIYNITGFACYAAYTSAGFFYPQETGIISDSNDVVFGNVCFIFTVFIGYQCFCKYERYKNKVSLLCKIVNFLYWSSLIIHYYCYEVFEVYTIKTVYWNIWYCMSYIKLLITVTKYIPQAYWNYLRKSTKGWSHKAVIMDWSGSVLSSLQILVQYMNGNNNAMGGHSGHGGLNIAKFGLSWISFLFDTYFLIQHYILYNPNKKEQQLIKQGNVEEIDPIDKKNIEQKLSESQSTQSTKCSSNNNKITQLVSSNNDIINNNSKDEKQKQQPQDNLFNQKKKENKLYSEIDDNNNIKKQINKIYDDEEEDNQDKESQINKVFE